MHKQIDGECRELEFPEIEPIANNLFFRPAGQMSPNQNKLSEKTFDFFKGKFAEGKKSKLNLGKKGKRKTVENYIKKTWEKALKMHLIGL